VISYRTLAAVEIHIGRLVTAIASPLAAALAMGAGVVGARVLLEGTLPTAMTLVSLSLFGAGIYGALMAAFRPKALRFLWKLGVEVMTRREAATEIERCAGS
jgi:hypothetical protein